MKIFAFFQGEYTGSDIRGKDYRDLIDFCFAHSFALSFRCPSPEHVGAFSPFFIRSLYSEETGGWLPYECFFYCTEKLRCFLLEHGQSLFDWTEAGGRQHCFSWEDPCFYRADGTALFVSCTHEGECNFALQENERVPEFVHHFGWEEIDESHPYYAGMLQEGTTAAFVISDHEIPSSGYWKTRGIDS